jgi:hypothetical protein
MGSSSQSDFIELGTLPYKPRPVAKQRMPDAEP